jgi:hypothetical protein
MDLGLNRLAGVAAAALVLGAAGVASARQGWVPPLERVDETVEDRDDLATSLRRLETGMHQPAGFEGVYRIQGLEGRFVRVQGGVYAVFPRSQYRPTRAGLLPTVPPDTVFHIGPPPQVHQVSPSADGDRPLDLPLDWRRDRRWRPPAVQERGWSVRPLAVRAEPAVLAGPTTVTADGTTPTSHRSRTAAPLPRTIVNDRAYRARRLRELVQSAASSAERAWASAPTDTEP